MESLRSYDVLLQLQEATGTRSPPRGQRETCCLLPIYEEIPHHDKDYFSAMPAKLEGPLDSGKLEDVKIESAKCWAPVRATLPSRWSFEVVRPAFLTRLTGRAKTVRPTAWLDGLRGFAALLVYFHHNELWAHEGLHGNDGPGTHILENAFGYEGKYYFATLPGIRTFFTGGHYSVTVFFVISGYVLSTKSISLIHAGDSAKLADALGSSLFRRWLRLYLPVMVTTFIYMCIWQWFNLWTAPIEMKGSWIDEFWNWWKQFRAYSFVFRTGDDPWFPFLYYNFHAWSIPVEFKGSIIIYTSLSAFSKLRTNVRLWCFVGMMIYFMYFVDAWYGSIFVSGMFLCELDMLAAKDQLPRIFKALEGFKELIFLNLLIVSVYLGGVPSHSWDTKFFNQQPGWRWLSVLKPNAVFDYKWFYLFWASTLLVAAVPRLPWLKRFFEGRFCQYLGRIAFALYLVHGPVLWLLADRIYSAVGYPRPNHKDHIPEWINVFPISKAGPLGLEPAFLIPQLLLLPTTLWLAEIVTKLIDEPSVKMTNKLYYRLMVPKQTAPVKA